MEKPLKSPWKFGLFILISFGAAFFRPLPVFGQSETPTALCESPESLNYLKAPNHFSPLSKLPEIAAFAQIILVGETHLYLPGKRELLMKALKPFLKNNGCVFYELDSTEYSSIENYLTFHSSSREDLIGEEFNELHQAALDLKVDEFLVDSGNNHVFLDLRHADLGPRNQFMAKKIQEQFENRKCDRGILFVGKAHLLQRPENPSLTSFLKEKNLSVLSLNLQISDEKDPLLSLAGAASWNAACPSKGKLPSPSIPILFQSSALPSNIEFGAPGSSGRWIDFDWTLLAK